MANFFGATPLGPVHPHFFFPNEDVPFDISATPVAQDPKKYKWPKTNLRIEVGRGFARPKLMRIISEDEEPIPEKEKQPGILEKFGQLLKEVKHNLQEPHRKKMEARQREIEARHRAIEARHRAKEARKRAAEREFDDALVRIAEAERIAYRVRHAHSGPAQRPPATYRHSAPPQEFMAEEPRPVPPPRRRRPQSTAL